jgi:hypothetical protein
MLDASVQKVGEDQMGKQHDYILCRWRADTAGAPTKLHDHSIQFYDLAAALLDGSKVNRETQRLKDYSSR